MPSFARALPVLPLLAAAEARAAPSSAAADCAVLVRSTFRHVLPGPAERAARRLDALDPTEREARRRWAAAPPAGGVEFTETTLMATGGKPPRRFLGILGRRDAQATLHRATAKDADGRGIHEFHVLLPRDVHAQETLERLEGALAVQPAALLRELNLLILHRDPEIGLSSTVHKHVLGSITSIIDVSPRALEHSDEELRKILTHALGRFAIERVYRKTSPGRDYVRAMVEDGNKVVSVLQRVPTDEDFAEGMVLYLFATRHGSPAVFEEARSHHPNRFRLFEAALDIIAGSPSPTRRPSLEDLRRWARRPPTYFRY